MSTTKTLGQIAFEGFYNPPASISTRWENSMHQHLWESAAQAVRTAVLAESKAASDVLHASLVTLSMEVTKMEALREECRQKDLIIRELRSSLPAQAPEEQGKTSEAAIIHDHTKRFLVLHEELRRLTRERDEAREKAAAWDKHELKKCEHCGSSEHLHTAMMPCPGCGAPQCCQICCQMENLRTRAESAEAHVKALEGELEMAEMLPHNYTSINARNHDLEMEVARFKADHTWIPISTPPTERDADKQGNVWIPSTTPFRPVSTIHYSNVAVGGHAFWMKPIPLPSATQTEDETERKAFEKNAGMWGFEDFSRYENGNYKDPHLSFAWLNAQASQKGAQV